MFYMPDKDSLLELHLNIFKRGLINNLLKHISIDGDDNHFAAEGRFKRAGGDIVILLLFLL